ncbi:MAG: hypothetical protein KAW52_06180 [candidate division Zixibacteria bacterium]|nr:hypothetical protein [candidate division Zixibacteria bacterium]
MGKNFFYFSILFFYSIPALAAFDNCGASAKALSLGHASTALVDETSVVSSNPAGLGFFNRTGFQVSLSRLFEIDELSEKEFYLVYPFNSFSFGGGTYIFGKANYYQETVLTFAFGYKLKDYLSFGSNLKYMRVSFSPTYKALWALGADFGAIVKLDNKAQLGAVVKNFNQPQLLDNSDDIPTVFSSGIAVFPFEEVTLIFDFSYDKRYKGQLHFGQEVKLIKNLPLRFGIQTSPAQYAFGVGFNFEKMDVDYAYLNHTVLGGTHKLSFSFLWGNKKIVK